MALESINSAITYQADSAIRLNAVKPAAEDTDGNAVHESGSVIDKMTKIVEKTDTQKEDGEENGQKQQGENSNLDESEKIKKYVENLNKQMTNSECRFGIHDETKRITIKIVDKDSKKVIKEFPPEKTLDMIAKVWELAGLLVDEKR